MGDAEIEPVTSAVLCALELTARDDAGTVPLNSVRKLHGFQEIGATPRYVPAVSGRQAHAIAESGQDARGAQEHGHGSAWMDARSSAKSS